MGNKYFSLALVCGLLEGSMVRTALAPSRGREDSQGLVRQSRGLVDRSLKVALELPPSQEGNHQISVSTLGARGDARVLEDARMISGSPHLISSTAHFGPGDLNKPVYVVGAGREGAPLSSSIISIVDPHTANLADPSVTAVDNTQVMMGADDTQALRAAIDKLGESGGGTLYFPSGVYRISSDLNITHSNIRLTGDGPASVIYESGMLLYAIEAKNDAERHVLQGGFSVHRAITIGVPGGTLSNVEIDHLQVKSIGRVWVHASIGQALIQTGANMQHTVRDFKLHDVTITTLNMNGYSNAGILDGFTVQHLTMNEVPKEAIYLAGHPSNGIVSDNQFSTDIDPSISNIGIAGKNMDNVKILRNRIAGTFWTCIIAPEFPQTNVLVDGNYCSIDGPNATDGIYFDHGREITVTNNTIEGARSFGITFRGPDRDISDIVIAHNTVRNGRGGAAISVMGGNDPENGPQNIAITDNTLIDNDRSIEALNVKGNNAIARNFINARSPKSLNAIVVKPFPGAAVLCKDNSVQNYAGSSPGCTWEPAE
jgi:hypothetical protein